MLLSIHEGFPCETPNSATVPTDFAFFIFFFFFCLKADCFKGIFFFFLIFGLCSVVYSLQSLWFKAWANLLDFTP